MTYDECEGAEVTRTQAIHEYEKHGLTAQDLFADCGCHNTYDAIEVLQALGY